MGDITLSQVVDGIARWVLGCSIASIILPPVEFFDDFPRFQKWYRLFCKFVKYFGALDFRAKVIEMYPSFQNRAVERAESAVAVAKVEKVVEVVKEEAKTLPGGDKEV